MFQYYNAEPSGEKLQDCVIRAISLALQTPYERIVELFTQRKEVEHLCRLVSNDKVLDNNSNLSVSSYVEPDGARDAVNIKEVNTRLISLIDEGAKLNNDIEAIIKELEA